MTKHATMIPPSIKTIPTREEVRDRISLAAAELIRKWEDDIARERELIEEIRSTATVRPPKRAK